MGRGVRNIEIATVDPTDDGIAMALLAAEQDLADAADRIRVLVKAHAERRGISMAAD